MEGGETVLGCNTWEKNRKIKKFMWRPAHTGMCMLVACKPDPLEQTVVSWMLGRSTRAASTFNLWHVPQALVVVLVLRREQLELLWFDEESWPERAAPTDLSRTAHSSVVGSWCPRGGFLCLWTWSVCGQTSEGSRGRSHITLVSLTGEST